MSPWEILEGIRFRDEPGTPVLSPASGYIAAVYGAFELLERPEWPPYAPELSRV